MDYKREKLQKKLKLWINGGVLTIPREVEEVILEEGLLSMESGVFTGCKALRSVRERGRQR